MSSIPGKTDTTVKTGATAGDRLIEAIFGDRVGDGLSDAERAMNARKAVWAVEDAAKADAQAAADAARAEAQAAAEVAKADAKAKRATALGVAGFIEAAKNRIAAEDGLDLWDHKIAVDGSEFVGQPELVKACRILAGEPGACRDRHDDIVAECYGLI
jgi:hypothetical protein